jgi:hypothetical protein
LPEGSPKAVIVGCLAADSTITAIKRLIDEAASSIELKRAIRAADQYKLEIE